MYQKLNFILIAMLFLIFSSTASFAQTYEELLKQYGDQFDEYKKQNEKLFSDYVKANDEAFADLLRKAWTEYNLVKGIKPPNEPKPNNIPTIDPQDVKKDKPIVVIIKDEEDNNNANKDDNSSNLNKVKVDPKTPLIVKEEPDEFPKSDINFDFYGQALSLSFDKEFVNAIPANIEQNTIADFWDKMVATNHYHFINQLMDYKTMMNLNDWGYFVLVQKSAEKIAADKNTANLLTWFIMMKSRYKVKIGFNQNNIYVLLPSEDMMYGKPYYTFDNVKYFVLDQNVGQLYTYPDNYPDAQLTINFDMSSPLNLGNIVATRNMKFEYNGKNYSFPVKYNKANIQYFDDYPHVNVKIYFDAAVSAVAKESLIENLKPIVAGLSEMEAVNTLMRFVQTGFDYQTDQQQFNREKFFFAEELFFYPYSDCEDRSILFSYLVRQLLGLEVVGLAFPGHMATAVEFKTDYGFDKVEYKGKNYVVCDPTYINANAGMCMPQFVNVAAKPVEILNEQKEQIAMKEIWKVLNDGKLYKASHSGYYANDKDGNFFITGYFIEEATLGTQKLTSPSRVNSVFVAKFNKNKQLVWVTPITGRGSATGHYINMDAAGNVFVSGFFEGTINFGASELTSQNTEAFAAKLDASGKIIWAQATGINEIKADKDYLFVARFSDEGELLSKLVFNETENFKNYGVNFDASGNVMVTGMVLASGLANAEQGTFNSYAYATSAANLPSVWKTEVDKLIAEDYDKTVAGLFAFIRTIKLNGSTVDGKTAQLAIDTYNPSFKKMAPTIYRALGSVEFVKNTGGIITISTKTGTDLVVSDDIILSNNTKLRVTTYNAGNAQIDFLSGAKLGKSVYSFDLNSIKLLKNSGDLIFDYDVNHTQKTYNLNKDILK